MNKQIQLSFNTRPFDFEDMLNYFSVTGRVPELHLKYFIEDGVDIETVLDKVKPLRTKIVDGGWCDFAKGKTKKLPQQLNVVNRLGVAYIRLFFTPMYLKEITDKQILNLVKNIQEYADSSPYTNFLFETHKGIGTSPTDVAEILHQVNRTNVGLVLDPINILLDGENPMEMMDRAGDHIKHVHLKGCSSTKALCEFGEGIDISEIIIRSLEYTDSFGIEYEGAGNVIEGLELSYKNFKQLCTEQGIEV